MGNNKEKVVVENVNVPGRTERVDAAKYRVMKEAMLKVLPSEPPGMTQAEIRQAVLPHLSDEHYPRGATAGWWAKTVQLDLEAKGVVSRVMGRPFRWHLSASSRSDLPE